jgi:hypothetical protein
VSAKACTNNLLRVVVIDHSQAFNVLRVARQTQNVKTKHVNQVLEIHVVGKKIALVTGQTFQSSPAFRSTLNHQTTAGGSSESPGQAIFFIKKNRSEK